MRVLSVLIALHISFLSPAQDRISQYVYFDSGNIRLEGILVRPNEHRKVPAVVFQQGSGPFSFEGYEEEAWGPHRFYIEEVLLEHGYAILYCNKRGLGRSEGNWKRNDLYGRAEDAYAAVQFLKSLPNIDSTHIGISGHSQGGWVAQIAAARYTNIDFVISLAGPTMRVYDQVMMNDSLQFLCDGYSVTRLERKMRKSKKKRKFGYAIGKVFPFIGEARFWYLIQNYEPDQILRSIQCPTLLLFAEHDIHVPASANVERLNLIFNKQVPTNIEVKVMPAGQHGFYQVSDRCVDWKTAEQQPFDPGFQNEIRKWLLRLDER